MMAVPRAQATLNPYSAQQRSDRFIAGARLAFTLCALLAIAIDPSEPPRHAPRVMALLAGYAVYALVTLGWAWTASATLGQRAALATQVIDIGVAALLMILSGGTASPFLSYMVFPLLSACLRWRWRGALATGGVLLAALWLVALYTVLNLGEEAFELNAFVIWIVYVVILTLVLAFLGAHDAEVRREMGELASWPGPGLGPAGEGVEDALGHVARVVDAPRALLVWQAADQPTAQLALWSGGKVSAMRTTPPAIESLVAEPLRESDFLCSEAADPDGSVLCMSADRPWRWRGAPLAATLQSSFAVRSVIAVALRSEWLQGRLFSLDKRGATSDDLVLATIVSRQVVNALEHAYLARRLKEAAIAEERASLSRDVHDGALQSLAALGLRLEVIRQQMRDRPEAARTGVEELQKLLELEQRQLRGLVRKLQTGGSLDDSSLADLLTELVLRTEREWWLTVKLDIGLPAGRLDASISPELAHQIHQLLSEALVNVTRHSLASVVRVGLRLEGDRVLITVADNGQGFSFRGRLEHQELVERGLGPVMLRQRTELLSGTLAIESSEEGARLEISLPRHVELRATRPTDPVA